MALAVATLFTAASTASAVTATKDPAALAAAAFRTPSQYTGGSFVDSATGDSTGVATESLAGFPLRGSTSVVLSSGDATAAPNASQAVTASTNVNGSTRGSALDVTALRLGIRAPSGTNCVAMRFRYFSEEYPQYVGQSFNDGFVAEIDPTTPWTLSNSQITASQNFAFLPGNQFVSVNSASPQVGNAAGTVYNGGTETYQALQPVTPGDHNLVLSVFDDGDRSLDSAVFIDDIAIFNAVPGGCTAGASVPSPDTTPPTSTITTPPSGATSSPTFSADDPSATFECRVDGGVWAICATPFTLTGVAPGRHVFEVRGTDLAGNTETTPASVTWDVPDATGAVPTPTPTATPAPAPACTQSYENGVTQFTTAGCFTRDSSGKLSTTQTVKVNGLPIAPAKAGTALTITPPTAANPKPRVQSAEAKIIAGALTVYQGKLDWRLPKGDASDLTGAQGNTVKDDGIRQLQAQPVAAAARLLGLRVRGTLAIRVGQTDAGQYFATLPLNLEMPASFSSGPDGGGVTAAASLRVDDGGVHDDGLKLIAKQVWLGKLRVEQVCISSVPAGGQSGEP